VCCSVLQCVTVCCRKLHKTLDTKNVSNRGTKCCIFLGHFPPKSPIISGSLQKETCNLNAFDAFNSTQGTAPSKFSGCLILEELPEKTRLKENFFSIYIGY